MTNMEKIQLCQEIVDQIQAESGRPVCRLHLSREPFGVADSHLGGVPYVPRGGQIPTDGDGNQLWLCAQINFSQMPRLEGFPDKGLLQFFLCTDEDRFESFYEDGCAWKQDAGFFQVRWYPEAPEDAPACVNAVPEKRWHLDSPKGGMNFEPSEEIATISVREDGGFAFDLGFEFLEDALTPIFQAAWEEDDDDEDEDKEKGKFPLVPVLLAVLVVVIVVCGVVVLGNQNGGRNGGSRRKRFDDWDD